jgi:hypothetical protein
MIILFNATFSYISVVSWQSVLLVEGIGENHRPPVDFIQVKVKNKTKLVSKRV